MKINSRPHCSLIRRAQKQCREKNKINKKKPSYEPIVAIQLLMSVALQTLHIKIYAQRKHLKKRRSKEPSDVFISVNCSTSTA